MNIGREMRIQHIGMYINTYMKKNPNLNFNSHNNKSLFDA